MTLDDLDDAVLHTFRRDKRHVPMLFGFKDGNVATIVGFEVLDDRKCMFVNLALLLHKHDCDSYGITAEAWAARPDPVRGVTMRPSNDPNRIEVLQLTRVYPDGAYSIDIWEIDDGKVIGRLDDMSFDSRTAPKGKEMQTYWAALLPGKGTGPALAPT